MRTSSTLAFWAARGLKKGYFLLSALDSRHALGSALPQLCRLSPQLFAFLALSNLARDR